MYYKAFDSKNIETISTRINTIYQMAIVSLGNVKLQLLNNEIFFFEAIE